ncbi:MAG: hypothetical protein ACJA2Q_002348 [Pseudohongiellaceae bacterium]|jgi:hypothetical protein
MSAIRITAALGCAGLLPFAGALFAVGLTLILGVELSFEPKQVFVFYSAVILSFLCGAIWGSLLSSTFTKKATALLILSNIVSLTAWISLLSYERHFTFSLSLLILGYLTVLAAEYAVIELLYKEVYRGYLKLRSWLTFCVVVLHLGMLFIN